MAGSENVMEGVADELLGWLQTESTYYADAMRGRSQRSPFGAEASESEKLEYYQRQMYQMNPDGSIQYDKPNTQGRQDILARLGVSGYAEVYNAVKPKAGRRQAVQDAGEPVEPASLSPMLTPAPTPAPASPYVPAEIDASQVMDAGPPPAPQAPMPMQAPRPPLMGP